MSDEQPLPTGLQLTALDPVFRERPHEYLDRLRTEDPMHHDAELGRLFLTRFEDVRAVVSNRSLCVDTRKAPDTVQRRVVMGDVSPGAFEPSMLQLDDPDHKRLRGLVSQAFNQRSVDALRPRIRVIADELLDAVSGRDSFDVIAEYSSPLPIIVIAEMLGVDAGDLARFKRWSDARSQVFNIARTPEQAAESATARQELDDYFARAVDERRGRRGTPILTASISSGPTRVISPLVAVHISAWERRLPAPRRRSPPACCSIVSPACVSIPGIPSSISKCRCLTG